MCDLLPTGVAVDNVGVDVPVKFGDSRSNRFRDIRGADFERKLAYSNSAKRECVSPNKPRNATTHIRATVVTDR